MFKVFSRTWWKENPDWPNGLEPSMGRKHTLDVVATEAEAVALCREYNKRPSGRLSRKAEFEDA
tara:strand:- start:711 stop:902 length:192 start_codon:yes stop_codon:yes gene_type:complete